MASLGILQEPQKLRRLEQIIMQRVSLLSPDTQQQLLENSTLLYFASRVNYGNQSEFVRSLIRATESFGTLPGDSLPSLCRLLRYLRDEVLVGQQEERDFVSGLLAPYDGKVNNSVPLDNPPTALPAKPTVLLLAANPADMPPLMLANEARLIGERLREGDIRDKLILTSEWAVRRADLSAHLLRVQPNIVHFSGHGTQEGVLLHNAQDESAPVKPDILGSLFQIVKSTRAPHLEVVLFNNCWSLAQAEAVKAAGIPYVIGMTKQIPDRWALAFAGGFYRGLVFDMKIPDAFRLGVNELASEAEDSDAGDIPQLL